MPTAMPLICRGITSLWMMDIQKKLHRWPAYHPIHPAILGVGNTITGTVSLSITLRTIFFIGSGWGERLKVTCTYGTVTQKHTSTHHDDLFEFCQQSRQPCCLLSVELELWFPMLMIMLQYHKHLYIINLNSTHTLSHSLECKQLQKRPRRNCCESHNIYWRADICLQITALHGHTIHGS